LGDDRKKSSNGSCANCLAPDVVEPRAWPEGEVFVADYDGLIERVY